jgi:hypothetical protein
MKHQKIDVERLGIDLVGHHVPGCDRLGVIHLRLVRDREVHDLFRLFIRIRVGVCRPPLWEIDRHRDQLVGVVDLVQETGGDDV